MARPRTPKERQLLMSAPMVRAILADRKTKTRRYANGRGGQANLLERDPESPNGYLWADSFIRDPVNAEWLESMKPMHPGDFITVREHFRFPVEWDATKPGDVPPTYDGEDMPIQYEAGPALEWGAWGKMRNSLHMPRWASRLRLEVVSVRLERLQAISREDAIAEGLTLASSNIEEFWRWPPPLHEQLWLSPVAAYRGLWEHINGEGSWAANPLVWVIEFRRVRSPGAA